MAEEECDCEEGAPAWMATFSDLATLLLTFFVLLLSFADMDVTAFKSMLGSVREAFGVNFESHGQFEALSSSPVSLDGMPTVEVDSVEEAEALGEMLEELQEDAELEATEGGLIIRIREQVLFPSASAELDVEAAGEILARVMTVGNRFASEVTIEGHTDDRPIRSSRFPSNWELSAARAASVVRFLGQQEATGDTAMSIAGYADTRPLVPNDSVENRARNRRVEFRFQPVRRNDADADVDAAPADAAGDETDDPGTTPADAEGDETDDSDTTPAEAPSGASPAATTPDSGEGPDVPV